MPLLIPKLQFFKSLSKKLVYDILTNNFKVDVTQYLKPEYCVSIKKYFEEISFYYDVSNDNKKTTFHRYNSWSNSFALTFLLFCLLRCLFYIFWNEDDQLVRTYAGNLEVFFGLNTIYFAIPQAGATIYVIIMFCLFQYSPINHLNWLKVFNAIEGRQSFVKSKIFMEKSANNLIRFTLIMIMFFSLSNHITPIYSFFFFMFFPLTNLNFQQFILYAFPWVLINTIWVMIGCFYFFASLIILIICYYYELRLNQLYVYVNLYLKRKNFKQINKQVSNLLSQYSDVINEIHQFNKFVSKLIFFLLLCCSSTLLFLFYNMVYVEIDFLLYVFYILFSGNLSLVITVVLMRTIRIGIKFGKNKCNLTKLSFIKYLTVKNKIKVR